MSSLYTYYEKSNHLFNSSPYVQICLSRLKPRLDEAGTASPSIYLLIVRKSYGQLEIFS